ncbi:replication protein A 70 kDa DNA-binding subunit B [Artemisia annua]|uniref:Replication protein A 70 kDa DNA-binding subunit B n=1 Tax=Artemisia annua TaxID=35608 RepID=A0A2U1KJZ3_ARTAN|nr:replication protein A 70 kDa DNA-binding subunit B [Artemisia annua]
MSQVPYTELCDVDPMLDDVTVIGRCISTWHSHAKGRPNDPWSLDAVFMDPQGNRIQATIKRENMSKFAGLLEEGACYRIRNFGVGENGGKYPLLPHKYKINFFKNTSLTRIHRFDTNHNGFKFEPFLRFSTRRWAEQEAVDVIGTIVSIGNPKLFGDGQKLRTVILEDAESQQLQCTFFDNWSDMFNDIRDNRESIGHVVIVLQLAKVKYWNDKPQVENALFGTKIYINTDLPEIVAFKERYKNKDGFNESSCMIGHYSPEKTIMTTESFFERSCKKTVGSIRDSDAWLMYYQLPKLNVVMETTLVVYAKIHKIHKEHGWHYLACRRCNVAVKELPAKPNARASASKKTTYKCDAHGVQVPVPKFKVIVRVIDETGSASLVLFDKMVHNLVDVSCAEILNKPSDLDMDGFPKQLNRMLGKKMLFKFLFSDYNISRNSHVYQVKAMSDDPDHIGFFKKDFLSEDVGDDFLTPKSVASSSKPKLRYADIVPFDVEETDVAVGSNQESGHTSGSSGEKRSFVDLDKSEDEHDDTHKVKKPVLTEKDKGKKPLFADLDKE